MKCRTVESNHTQGKAGSINCLRPSCGVCRSIPGCHRFTCLLLSCGYLWHLI
nr:MAG TPA: hypothetical protein [Caudoviricetes sp.]